MKIKLKPRQGWRFRVIVAADNGDYEYDDVNSENVVPAMAARLIVKLGQREEDKPISYQFGAKKK